jgi:indolepyruvate ferredoxin oxidoreductase, beta subunit
VTLQESFAPRAADPAMAGMIKLAVMAVGGQGGGVLAGWIETLARAGGYACQATSVAGVAQRTGATIYYLEMAPLGDRTPVFSLAPAAGDVDILLASEMMEAGRAVLRGFVTPDRTTLIASTHRALAVSEKMVPGDGIADADEVRAAAEIAARKLILFDMDKLALENGSVISASLFGALAGSGALPFDPAAFEAAISASGKGVDASIRAFRAGLSRATKGAGTPAPTDIKPPSVPRGPARLLQDWAGLEARLEALPAPLQAMARAGLRKVVDFQDIAYGHEYIDRLAAALAMDDASKGHVLGLECAKYIANAMVYDDVIRVADLKTRKSRFARIDNEMGQKPGNIMRLTEYFHPRAAEIAGLLPARLGARLSADPKWMARIERWFCKGRRLHSNRPMAFVVLYLLAGLRPRRRRCYRHKVEHEHLERWLATAMAHLPRDYDLGVEVIRCQRLIKGYSDTHARGCSKFDRVVAAADQLAGRADAAEWLGRLRAAALQDEEGRALDGALATVRSFL